MFVFFYAHEVLHNMLKLHKHTSTMCLFKVDFESCPLKILPASSKALNSEQFSTLSLSATEELAGHQQGSRLFLSPQPAAYRQMHKEFNRVDLMRKQRRTMEAVNAMDQLPSPPQPIGQTWCIDRGQ